MITKTHSIDIDEENLLSLLAALEFIVGVRTALENASIVTLTKGVDKQANTSALVAARVIRDNIMDQTGIELVNDRPTIQ